MLRLKKYIMIAVTGSVIFGCGAKTFVVDADKDSNLASLEKNIKKG